MSAPCASVPSFDAQITVVHQTCAAPSSERAVQACGGRVKAGQTRNVWWKEDWSPTADSAKKPVVSPKTYKKVEEKAKLMRTVEVEVDTKTTPSEAEFLKMVHNRFGSISISHTEMLEKRGKGRVQYTADA